MSKATFVDRCLHGEATLDDIDDYIDIWSESGDPRELHEFLGLDWDEYALWVERPASLRYVLFSRRFGVPLEQALAEYPLDREPVAARARSEAEARDVLAWLKKTGRLTN
jgi:hypothetical protein